MAYQRELWFIRQKESANSSHPSQPSDNSKPLRPYLVISSCYYSSLKVTVLPIQTSRPNIAHAIELLPTKENGLMNASWVVCSQIFTIEKAYFDKKCGIVSHSDFNLIHTTMTAYLAKKL